MTDEQITIEIEQAYEQDRRSRLNKRFLVYSIFSIGLILLARIARMVANLAAGNTDFTPSLCDACLTSLPTDILILMAFAIGIYIARTETLKKTDLFRYVSAIVLWVGFVTIVAEPMFADSGSCFIPALRYSSSASFTFLHILAIHLSASAFIPWTAKESFKMLIALCLFPIAAIVVLGVTPILHTLSTALFFPLAGIPGLLVCYIRNNRHRDRFAVKLLSGKYGQITRELSQARRIHDILFPDSIETGPIRLRYNYEPMRKIGGDFLYVRKGASGNPENAPITAVIMDVTGHGIGAALTVNRIHGELDRLFGENENLTPGEILGALNHYFNVALARHGIFATAFCMKIDPTENVIHWANAGHPPAFIIESDGTVVSLDSNSIMFGVLDREMFKCKTQTTPFRPGDRICAFTDGVIESVDDKNVQLGIEGFKNIITARHERAPTKSCLESVYRAVNRYRSGPPTDDTLIVEAFKIPDAASPWPQFTSTYLPSSHKSTKPVLIECA